MPLESCAIASPCGAGHDFIHPEPLSDHGIHGNTKEFVIIHDNNRRERRKRTVFYREGLRMAHVYLHYILIMLTLNTRGKWILNFVNLPQGGRNKSLN